MEVTKFYFFTSALLASSFQNTAIWLYILKTEKKDTIACYMWRLFHNHGLCKTLKCKSKKKPNQNKQVLPKLIMKIIWDLFEMETRDCKSAFSSFTTWMHLVYLTTKNKSKIPSSYLSAKAWIKTKKEENLNKSPSVAMAMIFSAGGLGPGSGSCLWQRQDAAAPARILPTRPTQLHSARLPHL